MNKTHFIKVKQYCRILVKDQYHSIHLCALKEKEPTFLDLLKKVQRITEVKTSLAS
jgi:hypothetical protein